MDAKSGQDLPQSRASKPRPPRVPAELIGRIKTSVNMVDLVGEHVVLRKSGANWVGLCPFHNERSPSFSVHESKQLYHCYGCKEGGDIVNFVMEIHGLTFSEAVEELATRAQIALPVDFSRYHMPGQSNAELQKCFKLNRFVASFYRNQLLAQDAFAKSSRQYLQKRAIEENWQRNFYVGAAPNDWDLLTRFLIQSKSPLETAEKLGLIIPSKQKVSGKPPFFDFLRHRIIFPILDTRGRVIAFSGRLLDGEGPKYLNSPDSLLYSKSKAAFGLYQAKRFIRENDEVIVVEGQFDVLAMHQMGFTQTVATCGTALTAEHIELFQRLGKRIIILFDGDAAGQSAAERAMELGLRKGLAVLGAVLPKGQDPNELLIQGGQSAITDLIKKARPLLDLAIDEVLTTEKIQSQTVGASQARVDSLRRIGHWLGQFTDPIGRAVRIQSLVEQQGFSAALLQGASQAVPAQALATPASPSSPSPAMRVQASRRPSPSPAPAKRAAKIQLSRLEKHLFRALVLGTDSQKLSVIDQIGPKLPPSKTLVDCFSDPQVRQFLDSLGMGHGHWDATYFADSPAHLRSLFTAALSEGSPVATSMKDKKQENPSGLSPSASQTPSKAPMKSELSNESDDEKDLWLNRILAQVWARFSHELKAALASAEAQQDVNLLNRLSQDYLDVQRKMKEFNSFYVKDSNP